MPDGRCLACTALGPCCAARESFCGRRNLTACLSARIIQQRHRCLQSLALLYYLLHKTFCSGRSIAFDKEKRPTVSKQASWQQKCYEWCREEHRSTAHLANTCYLQTCTLQYEHHSLLFCRCCFSLFLFGWRLQTSCHDDCEGALEV